MDFAEQIHVLLADFMLFTGDHKGLFWFWCLYKYLLISAVELVIAAQTPKALQKPERVFQHGSTPSFQGSTGLPVCQILSVIEH